MPPMTTRHRRLFFLPIALLTLVLLCQNNHGQLKTKSSSVEVSNKKKSLLARQNNKFTARSAIIARHHSFSADSNICSLVDDTLLSTSPSRWWTANFDTVLEASLQQQKQQQQQQQWQYKYTNDDNDDEFRMSMRSWTQSLLASLSPSMLQQGIKSRPSSKAISHVANVIYKRMRTLTTNNHDATDKESSSPPLVIAVMGGSVTKGHGCLLDQEAPPGMPAALSTKATMFNATTCAWPSRLESLINSLAGMKVVQVYNLAVGATNLDFAIPVVKYGLFPSELVEHPPDVIISSYSTNEQAQRIIDDDTTATLLQDWKREERSKVQAFVKACWKNMGRRPGEASPPPLVVFVDDYLGNQQKYVWREVQYNQIVTQVADWYPQVMHVSYADVVRKHVYAETNETTFSPSWRNETTGEYKRAVHFGMGGHTAIAYTLLYAMMDMISGYCIDEEFRETMEQHRNGEGIIPRSVVGMVESVPPPDLTETLSLENISREWKENAECAASNCNKTVGTIPCSFAFASGTTVTSRKQLDNYLRPHLIANTGWESTATVSEDGYVKKLGLVATGLNATMTLVFPNIDTDVKVINVQHLKSYGDKWMDSRARFTFKAVSRKGDVNSRTFKIGGHHNHSTSVSYPFEYKLKQKVKKGSDIALSIDLDGGKRFKILSLMLCSK